MDDDESELKYSSSARVAPRAESADASAPNNALCIVDRSLGVSADRCTSLA
jgi:hypothetical protein